MHAHVMTYTTTYYYIYMPSPKCGAERTEYPFWLAHVLKFLPQV